MLREPVKGKSLKVLSTNAQQGAESLSVVMKRCNGRGAKGGPVSQDTVRCQPKEEQMDKPKPYGTERFTSGYGRALRCNSPGLLA